MQSEVNDSYSTLDTVKPGVGVHRRGTAKWGGWSREGFNLYKSANKGVSSCYHGDIAIGE